MGEMNNDAERAGRLLAPLSLAGLFVGILFFAISLSPSLIPRNFLVQGALSGVSASVGYFLGWVLGWSTGFLEVSFPPKKFARPVKITLFAGLAILVAVFLWRLTIWQESIRGLMGMETLDAGYSLWVALVALAVAALLITLARLFIKLQASIARRFGQIVPVRLAFLLSMFLALLIVFSAADNLLVRQLMSAADEIFADLDAVVPDGFTQPTDPDIPGSEASLVGWDDIGRRGKYFVLDGPRQADIAAFNSGEAKRPIRVYVGLGYGETLEERAELALAELIRVKAFERSVLIVATPTGTGWLDPGGVDTVEYLHGGDTAIVSMQYSYLPSWMTLIVEPEKSSKSARSLFKQVYAHWKTLPKDNRPKLYLHGLSLGALGSEASAQLFLMLEDFIQGAVWSGSPFPSQMWAAMTAAREPGSPAWLPRFGDGSLARFTAQKNALKSYGDRWGPIRMVYIQYASDPMVFFSPTLLYRRPDWLVGKRGPDVSPYFEWYPVVSFLQVGFDMILSTSVPIGHGHNYSASNYIDAWLEVTAPSGWTPDRVDQLKTNFKPTTLKP